jgi:hypothetical protein
VFNVSLLGFVEMNLDQTRAIQLDADSFANNLSREAEIIQDRVMNRCQSATPGSLLLALRAHHFPCRLGQDTTLESQMKFDITQE